MNQYGAVVRPKFNGSPSQWAKKYETNFCGLGNYPVDWEPQLVRTDDLRCSLGTLALHHFGFAIERPAKTILSQGVDVALDYFTGDWWRWDKRSARVMDKSKNRRGLIWFEAFSHGLLLALLSKRWEVVRNICDWVESDTVPDEYEDGVDKELGQVYKIIAARLRSNPMDGVEKIEKLVVKCKSPRSKLLFDAWQGARNKDEVTYEGAVIESLKHFKKMYGKGPRPFDWIARHDSVLVLAAERLGMKPPSLPIDLKAVLMTPKSVR